MRRLVGQSSTMVDDGLPEVRTPCTTPSQCNAADFMGRFKLSTKKLESLNLILFLFFFFFFLICGSAFDYYFILVFFEQIFGTRFPSTFFGFCCGCGCGSASSSTLVPRCRFNFRFSSGHRYFFFLQNFVFI